MTNAINNPNRLVTKSEVQTITSYSDASIWRLEHLPESDPRKFPGRIRLSRNRVCWRQQEVLDWINRQKQAGNRADRRNDPGANWPLDRGPYQASRAVDKENSLDHRTPSNAAPNPLGA